MKQTWQERLQRFEATPPARVWDRVEEQLDDPASVAERLQAFTAPPPAGLWNKIEQQLDAEAALPAEAPVVLLPRRRRSFFAYAAAAAILGVLLVGSAILLNRQQATPPVAVHSGTPTSTPAAPQVEAPVAVAPAPTTASDVPAVPARTPAAARTTPRATAGVTPAPEPTTIAALPQRTFASATLARRSTAAAPARIDDERYLVRAYNNGNTVRFSKKVSAVVDCAEHATGFSQSLCKVSIGAAQEKMATTVSTGFGGLMERLQDLETSK